MQISKMVLYFDCSPLELSQDQMEEYLFVLRQNEKPSLSSFKHLVYGLRTLFAMFKSEELLLALPSISSNKALPVVLSQQEIKALLDAPKLLKHRVLFALIYDGGLRISELINLRIEDLDFNRKRMHIRQSKHKKDRDVPISPPTIRGFNQYFRIVCPSVWEFNGKLMYNLLFEKSWETILSFARDPKLLGAQPGDNAILHTWDQQLKYHPHVHYIIPAGGMDKNGKWKTIKQNGDFLFDVK